MKRTLEVIRKPHFFNYCVALHMQAGIVGKTLTSDSNLLKKQANSDDSLQLFAYYFSSWLDCDRDSPLKVPL